MSKLRTEDIQSLVRNWINEDWSVRSLSLGRGHWEEMAEVLNDAAYERGFDDGCVFDLWEAKKQERDRIIAFLDQASDLKDLGEKLEELKNE